VRILIFNGAPVANQERTIAAGGRSNTALFSEALSERQDGLDFFTLNVADAEQFPQGLGLADFDGVVISGSPLNVYKNEPRVAVQLELARAIFHAGIPCFGSCWGLQLMTAALGGSVRLNPKGREFGIARNIGLTDDGRAHPLYAGKATAFDALCSHEDEIDTLPSGSIVLASNAVSRVQAAEITQGDKSFWGVQYHPEFDLPQIATLLKLRAAPLAGEGFLSNAADAEPMANELCCLSADISRTDLAWRYGVTADVLNTVARRMEFANWLQAKVRPFTAARA
jgi:GMP synthase (glutamine-hydrolysing)